MTAMTAAARRIVPLFDRLLVQRIKPEQRTKSGLFIPEKAQQQPNTATVVAVGKDVSSGIRPNDTVLLPSFGGSEVRHEGSDLLLFHEKDILAKIEA